MNVIHIPSTLKPSVCIWEDLNTGQLDRIDACGTAEDVKGILAEMFNLRDYDKDLKMGIIIDLFYYTLQFAKENNFSQEQTSAFFSIVKRVHMANIDTPFGNIEAVYKYFKELLFCHSVNRPPYSIYIFSVIQVKLIITYVINTYFRHLKLYKYAFTPKIRMDIAFDYVGMPANQLIPVEEEKNDDVEEDTGDKEIEEIVETKGETTETTDSIKGEEVEADEADDSKNRIKTLITTTLQEQLQQMKLTIDHQIRQNDDIITSKIKAVEESVIGKGGKGSKTKRR
ncbi:Coiled-coil domain-containing protein 189 [Trichoplax sp. H2]|nr:Coiled-coil domain-containing protein 189 [Trichoplax sp. H2]|eukprot:RDD43205.1 Coiled-coil domain-containing protein 189 [Trichoplax sp. H2]